MLQSATICWWSLKFTKIDVTFNNYLVRRANTSVPQQSEVSSIATSEPYVTTVSSEPTSDKNYESSSASENTETSQSEAMIETTTHTMSAVERMEKARQRARKLNMERFMVSVTFPSFSHILMLIISWHFKITISHNVYTI